jgi:hypothetical protein
MIEHTVIDGKPATVAYIKNGWKPGTKDDHDFVKITFEDGRMVIATKK